jgi:hypothetical protein
MRPLTQRLTGSISQALADSEGAVLVRHLEAASAAEESLLLLMGFSRLGGQRQFVPQADATVELRIDEEDAIGMSFEETGILLGVRVRKGTTYVGEWMSVRGKVSQFDDLAAQAVRKTLDALDLRAPGKTVVADMALRRKQAEAELKTIRQWSNDLDSKDILPRKLAHIETAVKLDPTYQEAASELLCCLSEIGRPNGPPPQRERLIQEAIRYVDRFGSRATKRDMDVIAGIANDITVALDLWKSPRSKAKPLSPIHADSARMSRKFVEMHLAKGSKAFSERIFVCAYLGYYGLVVDDVPAEQRRKWVEGVLVRMDEHAGMIRKNTAGWTPPWTIDHYGDFRLRMAQWALIDGDAQWASQLIRDAVTQMQTAGPNFETPVLKKLLAAAAEMGVSTGQDAVAGTGGSLPEACDVVPDRVVMQELALPRLVLPPGEEPQVQTRQLAKMGPVSPLLAAGDRLFIVRRREYGTIDWGDFEGSSASGPQDVGVLKLDADGSAAGDLVFLPHVETKNRLHVHAACLIDERLVLATRDTGIVVVDLKAKEGKAYGAEQGLPVPRVNSLLPTGDGTVLAAGATDEANPQVCHFIFDPRDGKSTLLRRGSTMEGKNYPHRIILAWQDGKKLRAWMGSWGATSFCEDLLDPSASFRRLKHLILSAARIGDRLFLLDAEGLAEANLEGHIVRRWPGPTEVALPGRSAKLAWPLESPIQTQRFVVCGQVLLFSGPAMVAYDTRTDTWYGPVRGGAASYAIGTGQNVWFGTGDGMIAVSIAAILKTARDSGRVWTTAQWQEALRKSIAESSLLEQAKVALIRRRFAEARELTERALSAEPGKPEALLLMGWLCEQEGKRAKAAEWYDKLIRHENPSASFTGASMMVDTLSAQKKHRQALELVEKTLKRFPKMPENSASTLKQMAEQLRKAVISESPAPTSTSARAAAKKREGKSQ